MVKINLQFFGGRGASYGGGGGGLKQVIVDYGGGQKSTYRIVNGKTYVIGAGNSPEREIPRTLNEIITRAKESGYNTKTYTKKEYEQYEKEYKKSRSETDKILDRAYVSDKEFVKGSRMSRIGNRATRKKK